MSFYTTKILPTLLDKATSSPETEALRREVLAPARGRVLEIGFGTGRNIPHLPAGVTSVVGLEPNPGVEKLARPRIIAASIPIELQIGSGEQLPFPSACFDMEYGPTNGMDILPETELIFTMRPGLPCKLRSAPSNGAKACVTITCPITLISS